MRCERRATRCEIRLSCLVLRLLPFPILLRSCLLPCFDSEAVVDADYHHGEWCSSVVCYNRSRAAGLIAAEHGIFVVRGKNHHVRMPVSGAAKNLVRGPHVSKTDALSFWQSARGIRVLNRFCDLVRRFALQAE